ncbi:hypothetical protein MMC28_005134 [Mycoblastus sanguinarius]|nr:hypothetical protein [Mycoblastus sanguinarius]
MDANPSLRHSYRSEVGSWFTLSRLPPELQIQILRLCLISPIPVLNAGIKHIEEKQLTRHEFHEARNPSETAFGILFTCKLYYYEGLKVIYSADNCFTYAGVETDAFYCFNQMCYCNPCSKDLSHNLNLHSRVKSLHLRPLCPKPMNLVERTRNAILWTREFQGVQNLRVDFVGVDRGYYHQWDKKEHAMNVFCEHVKLTAKALKQYDPNGGLKSLTLTGLPKNDLALFMAKQLSPLLAAGGKMGVGIGDEGNQYDYSNRRQTLKMLNVRRFQVKRRKEEAKIHWMGLEDIDAWIDRETNTRGSKWLSEVYQRGAW